MVQTTINKILFLALCVGYSSTLYTTQHDVDDEKEPYHAGNDGDNKGQHNETRIIKRPTSDFDILPDKRRDGGASMDIQYFRDKKSGKTWIGKCNIKSFLGVNNDEEYREALGFAIYRFFGITTPDFAVSIQPVAPRVKSMVPHGTPIPVGNKTYYVNVNRPCMHIMSQVLDGFKTFGDAFPEDQKADKNKAVEVVNKDTHFMQKYKKAAKEKKHYFYVKEKYPLKGLGAMLAVANFIYDMDCIGNSGGNLGYRIQGNHAQVVKIDPGYTFSFLENHGNKEHKHNPMDRKTHFGTQTKATLDYHQLTPGDQKAFAAMGRRILETPREKLKKLIDGVVVEDGWKKEMADKVLSLLIARQQLFITAFSPEIGDDLRRDREKAYQRLYEILAWEEELKEICTQQTKLADSAPIKQEKKLNHQAQKPFVEEIFQRRLGTQLQENPMETSALPLISHPYKVKEQKNFIIKRPTSDFQPMLQKGRPPGGSSTDIQYFREVKSGGLWIGKCNINAWIGANNHEEYREALGLSIYRFFGIITPEFAVSVQPVAPIMYEIFPHGERIPMGNKVYRIDKNRPCMHIMTQFLDGFSTCADAFKEDEQDEHKDEEKDNQKAAAVTDDDSPFMRAYKRAAKAKQSFHLTQNGKKYPLKGLGTMLAVANFIYDINCIGKSGGNLGYLIKGNYAQAVKIDPGDAFSFLLEHTNKKFKHNPMDRKTFFGTDESATLGYDQLTPVDQQAFAAMAKHILQTPRKTLKQLIDGIVVPGGWQQQMADKLLDHLIARKSLFLAAFAPEIDDNLRQEIRDAKHRLVGSLVYQKGPQKQSKGQIQAYQKYLKEVRAWEAKVAANRLIKQKEHQNNQAQKPSSVKEPFQLPNNAREDLFTGRQQERAAMAAFFGTKRKKACAFQAITGVGGLGKTHLALHYAHACAEGAKWVPHRYDAILWFYAEAGLDSQFHELAKVWGKKDCKTAEEAVAFVYKALQQQNRTLLVFDNAEQSQEVVPYLPPRRQKRPIDILITTRNPALDLRHYGKPTYITLSAFTKKEGRTYIQKVLGHKGHSQQNMDALWETVSGLPIALNYALEYIAKGKCTLEKYPAHFAEHQLRLGTQLQASPVVTSVLLSVLTLREEYPIIEPMLVTAAYLAPEKVPTSAVFTLLDAKITKQTKEQALAVLHKYGLLTIAKDRQTFDFHRLVQQVLRAWHRSKKGQAGHEALLKDWMAYFQKNLEYDDRDLNAIYSISPLIPHACAIADGDSTSAAIEKAQAGLYSQIGYHQLVGVAHYDRAKQCYQKALAIKEKHYGVGHIETASTMVNLGSVLLNLGDYAQAKQCYEKALKIQEKHYGADHPTTANTMSNLGNVLSSLGDYALAKLYFQKALKINEKHYGAHHPTTARTMQNLGIVLLDLGDYALAKQYFQKVLKIQEKHYGAHHPTTASTMMNLGIVLSDLGDYALAKQYFQKALKIQEKHYGADHPETASTMMNLGIVLSDLGDYALAKQYFQKVLKIQEKHYGAQHPTTARTMQNLGNVLRNLGDYAQAKIFFQKALKIQEKHYGADHPQTASTMMNLGTVLSDLGDYALAKQYFQKVLKIQEKHYGADHPETASTMMNLGIVLSDLGDYAQAKQYFEKALRLHTQHYGAHHPRTARTMGNLGVVFKKLGQYEKARECFQQNIKVYTKHYGANHSATKQIKRNLAILEEEIASQNNKKQPKTALGSSFNLVTDKPNKVYKVHKQPKDDSSDDETISLDVLADHFKNNPIFTQWLTYMHDNECDTDCILEEARMDTIGKKTVIPINNILFNNIKKYIQATQTDQKSNYIPQESDNKVKPRALEKEDLEKALKVKEQHYGPDHPSTATTMSNLGYMLLNQGDYALAKQYLEKALKIKAQHYGADHPSTAKTMRSLGEVHCALAQEYYKKSLKIDEQHYGADHPEIARKRGNLGLLFQNLGQYAKASECYQQNIKVFTKHYGANHLQTKRVQHLLATLKEDLIDGEKDADTDNSYTLFDHEDISLDVLAQHLKNNPTFTAWLEYMHYNACDTDVLLYTVQGKDDDNILYDGFKGDKNILLEVTNFIEKKEKTKPEAKKTKKHAKSTLDNPLNQVTDKPNKVYKVHKQPKHASGADEKENDTQDNKELAPQQQPKSPKIDSAKKQKEALTRETYLFVEAMKGQLAKTPVPVYLGSGQWNPNAAATFVGKVLRMCREQQYTHLLSHPENYGIPAPLIPFIKAYISNHPQLQQLVHRPDFCKSYLEKPLMLGQVDQLHGQFQPNEEKEADNQKSHKEKSTCIVM